MASIEKRMVGGKARFLVRYRDPVGKSRAKTFTRKGDADAFKVRIESDLQNDDYIAQKAGAVLLSEWGEGWLTRRTGLKRRTVESQRSLWRSRIEPTLGGLTLNRVKFSTVEHWLADMGRGGLSASRQRQAVGLLRQMLDGAVKDGLLRRNPCEGIDLPPLPEDEAEYPTIEEVDKVLLELAPTDRLFIQTMVLTGLRFGEAAGLQVRSLDLDGAVLTVQDTLTDVGGVLAPDTPKGRRKRPVVIPGVLVTLLREHTAGKAPSSLVFTAPRGGPIRYNNWRNRRWLPACERAGLSVGGAHSLRHLHSALLDSSGAQLAYIKQQMGHRSAELSTGRYGHVLQEQRMKIASALDSMTSQWAVGAETVVCTERVLRLVPEDGGE